jgi:hypothetical protein
LAAMQARTAGRLTTTGTAVGSRAFSPRRQNENHGEPRSRRFPGRRSAPDSVPLRGSHSVSVLKMPRIMRHRRSIIPVAFVRIAVHPIALPHECRGESDAALSYTREAAHRRKRAAIVPSFSGCQMPTSMPIRQGKLGASAAHRTIGMAAFSAEDPGSLVPLSRSMTWHYADSA